MKRILDVLLHPEWWNPICTWPVFSATSYAMVRRLHQQGLSPRTIIDVGANVGQFAVACATIFPAARIYAFEPNPASACLLEKNVSKFTNVTVFTHALGEEQGEATFHINSHSHSSSLLPLGEHHKQAFPQAKEISDIQVPVRRLDDLEDGLMLAAPVLLKLDVQGFEPQVLAGATKVMARTDYVLVESSFKPMYKGEVHFRDLQELLLLRGFTFDRPLDFLKHPKTNEILQMDALFSRLQ
jgi:FkbM family methyltransferase